MKTLRTAALVVGAAALVASGVGAVASLGLVGVAAGSAAAVAGATTSAAILASATAVASIAGAVSGALFLAAGTPKGTIGGSATQFKIDKDSGIPIIIGRTPAAYQIVRRIARAARDSEWRPTERGRAPA